MARLIGVIMLLFLGSTAWAGNDIYTGWFSNKAVSGYDTVAYFTESKAVKGNAKFKFKYLDAEWYFNSDENLELFKNNPDKYRPQYGGFCAWAVATKKQRAPGDPNYWKIVDGKLYLNYDNSVQKQWLEDIPGFIRKADENWPKMLDQ
ncbi:YHS domain-containing (seleno)protein [Endozoicomonas lisbonensis]|uniref:YHS domain-containing protein n=1 Tax=Endozoicomonas lisbonensis TaxID=3120522 RepID=A0ABV2SIU8_9GAMM